MDKTNNQTSQKKVNKPGGPGEVGTDELDFQEEDFAEVHDNIEPLNSGVNPESLAEEEKKDGASDD